MGAFGVCNIGEIDDDDDNDEFIPVSPSTIWGMLRGGYDINVGFILEEKKLAEKEFDNDATQKVSESDEDNGDVVTLENHIRGEPH